MTKILLFLRHLDRRRLVWIVQRLLAVLLPMRPYRACAKSSVCPCPARRPERTEIAVQADQALVQFG